MIPPVVGLIDDAAAAVVAPIHTITHPFRFRLHGRGVVVPMNEIRDGVRSKDSNKIAKAPPVDRAGGRPDHAAGVVEAESGPHLSRDPSDYRATDHFIAQKRHRPPKPSSSIIRQVFDDGGIERGNKPGTFTFTKEIRGLRWVIPVAVPGDPPLPDHSGYALSIFALGRSGAQL